MGGGVVGSGLGNLAHSGYDAASRFALRRRHIATTAGTDHRARRGRVNGGGLSSRRRHPRARSGTAIRARAAPRQQLLVRLRRRVWTLAVRVRGRTRRRGGLRAAGVLECYAIRPNCVGPTLVDGIAGATCHPGALLHGPQHLISLTRAAIHCHCLRTLVLPCRAIFLLLQPQSKCLVVQQHLRVRGCRLLLLESQCCHEGLVQVNRLRVDHQILHRRCAPHAARPAAWERQHPGCKEVAQVHGKVQLLRARCACRCSRRLCRRGRGRRLSLGCHLPLPLAFEAFRLLSRLARGLGTAFHLRPAHRPEPFHGRLVTHKHTRGGLPETPLLSGNAAGSENGLGGLSCPTHVRICERDVVVLGCAFAQHAAELLGEVFGWQAYRPAGGANARELCGPCGQHLWLAVLIVEAIWLVGGVWLHASHEAELRRCERRVKRGELRLELQHCRPDAAIALAPGGAAALRCANTPTAARRAATRGRVLALKWKHIVKQGLEVRRQCLARLLHHALRIVHHRIAGKVLDDELAARTGCGGHRKARVVVQGGLELAVQRRVPTLLQRGLFVQHAKQPCAPLKRCESGLVVHELDRRPWHALLNVLGLLGCEQHAGAQALQFFVRIVDEQLLEAVGRKILESEDV
mmetsp:Transcript_2098/g.8333  ORF Transcript_2098/g.8333 Transcript_2098/m.8333 type:complete len:634 (-) Transcript_2098:1271-3172(-)